MVQSLKENKTLKNALDTVKNTPIPVAVRTVDTGIGMKLPYIEFSTVGEVAGKFSKASTVAKDDAYQLAKGSGGVKGTGNTVHRSEIDEVIKNDYDIDGNLVNRSIVPKGYDSVEDFLTKVDDTTIKEFGYDSVEEFKAVVGYVDAHLNASPKHNIINKGLAGGTHMKGIDYDVLGFPIFKGEDVKFTHKLDESLFIAKDDAQFEECTRQLKAAINKGEIPRDIFTPKQLKMIELELPRIVDLTWHHHQVPGKMQLVVSAKHSVNHLGGNKLWGGGIR